MFQGRTDLALEAAGTLTRAPGVAHTKRTAEGVEIWAVEITTAGAAQRLGKPVGRYVTVELDALRRREEEGFRRTAQALAEELTRMLPSEGAVLVVGLGNRAMTPDRLGPACCDRLLVTRHLVEREPGRFGCLRPVSALTPGVLGTTGVESALAAKAVASAIQPACVVAVDALAARGLDRLCATAQLSDTGIAPGSGVGNHRQGLTQAELGVPVIALGVPTVAESEGGCFVTPRDIDLRVDQCAKVLAAGLNLALQPGLTLEDLEGLVE